jgi:hypothetical protein
VGGQKLNITLEFLQTSDHQLALVWREISENGPIAKINMAKVVSGSYPLHRLRELGWIETRGTTKVNGHRNSHPMYVARTTQSEEPRNPTISIEAARRRLTKIALTARNARVTGLAFDMGKALREIETEARFIRDAMPREARGPSEPQPNGASSGS